MFLSSPLFSGEDLPVISSGDRSSLLIPAKGPSGSQSPRWQWWGSAASPPAEMPTHEVHMFFFFVVPPRSGGATCQLNCTSSSSSSQDLPATSSFLCEMPSTSVESHPTWGLCSKPLSWRLCHPPCQHLWRS